MARKKPIISPLGQWAYPGEVTIIPSSDITMKGVNYPVLGVDNLGNSQMMMPGQDYTFPGDYVTEIPQMGKGGLAQWFDEKWVDVKTGKACGRSGKDKDGRPYPACRPSKRVNETTPKTSSELSSAEKARFKREKTSGKRIDYNHKRREEGGETGWLDEYQVGGVRRPIYTSNPNDPRLQRFNDSLSLYEKSKYLRNLSQNSASNTNVLVDGDKVFTPYKNWKPFVYDPIDLRKRNALTRAAILSYQADELRDYNNLANSINKRHSTIKPESILTLVSSSRFPNGQRFTESLGAIYKRPVAPIYYKKPTALPKVYKKPEVVPEVVETPVAPSTPVPVVEPPKPSLFVSNIDRDMYTPGGGMAREYNIGVTLQDGNRKSFRTEKEFQDWKAANNLDISKAKVTEGRGYSYDYPENKKYGGWLNKYQTGGGTEQNPERMQGVEIFKKRSWLDKLRGYVHKGEKAIGLDPYNERSDDFMEQWARRINTATGGKDWYKQPNDASGTGGIGTAMMETVMAPFSAPQLASVYGATGKVQMPSEAMNIQNPVGSFLADAILDPTNLVGAGIAKNLGKGSLQNMIRNRSRGVRPDFTPNVSNQLAPPPSEIIVDPTTGQFNSYFNQDMERPYFDEWVRMMNNNASELDVSNLFANPAESIDLRKLKKIAKNRSGLTKEEILKNASPKDKEVLSKMSESEFEQTVLKPTGEVVPYEPAVNLGLGFNTNTRNLNLSDVIPMDNSEYVDIFNSRLDRLNEIISRNNKSGLDYSVKGLSPSGALTFNTPAQIEKLAPDTAVLNQLRNRGFMDEAGNIDPRFQDYADRWGITGNRNIPQGESTWMLDINPGQWRGEVEDIANAEYFKAIPGLNMRNTTASVFSDALPRRGTGTYNSINEYLKELDLGRVKPGFNSQSQSSSGLWEDAIKKGKAFGYFNNPGTVYGSMRTVAPLVAGAAAASQLQQQKQGGQTSWLNKYK
jgi:hypothetical protein